MAIIKVLRPHRDGCLSVLNHPENPWAYFGSASKDKSALPSVLYMDAMGRKAPDAYRRWLTAGCNDPECSAALAIQESALLRFAQFAIERKPK